MQPTPLTVASMTPDLRTKNSSPESLMPDWVLAPALRVVMWLSSRSKVSVREFTTLIREPVGVGVEGRLWQSMTDEGRIPGAGRCEAGTSPTVWTRSV